MCLLVWISVAMDRNSISVQTENVAHTAKDFLYDRRMEIDEWIAKARAARGWTQSQLAEALNVTRANVSAWENKRHEPSLAQIRQISALCGVDAHDLFDEKQNDRVTVLVREHPWPFAFDYNLFDRLPAARKAEAELILRGYIAQHEDRAEKRGSGT